MSDFLPCPFCGWIVISVVEGETFRWRVSQCGSCGAMGPDVRIQTMGEGTREGWERDAKRECMAEWNRRPIESDLRAENERLRKDAERYRWLRANCESPPFECDPMTWGAHEQLLPSLIVGARHMNADDMGAAIDNAVDSLREQEQKDG